MQTPDDASSDRTAADPTNRLRDRLDDLVGRRIGSRPDGALVWPNAVQFGTGAAYLRVGYKERSVRRRTIVGEITVVVCLWSIVATAMLATSDPLGSAVVLGLPATVLTITVIMFDQMMQSTVEAEDAMATAIDAAAEPMAEIRDLVDATIASAADDPLIAGQLPEVVRLLETRLGMILERPGDPVQVDSEELNTSNDRKPHPNRFELTTPPGTGDMTERSTYTVPGSTFPFPAELDLTLDGHAVTVTHFRAHVDHEGDRAHGTFDGNQGTRSAFTGSFRC